MKIPTDNEIRIIGGQWRGRKIHFPDVEDLRPSIDRVRETLFNWLAPIIHDSVCLDLFAGSGVLGFEALSRGANMVYMVDSHPEVIHHLKKTAQTLKTNACEVLHAIAPFAHLKHLPRFDIVFLDPPFNKELLSPCCHWLEKNHLLNPNAFIYVESEIELTTLDHPPNWECFREKTAGKVCYRLFISR